MVGECRCRLRRGKFLVNVALLIDIPALIAPDAPALVGAESLDFGGLRAVVAKGGGLLHELGVGRGDRVGVISTNSVEYLQAMFAAALVGAVCVPMNYRANPNEIAHLLADSGVKVLLVGSRYAEMARAYAPATVEHVVVLDTGGADGWRERSAAAEEFGEIVEVDERDVAILLYTSGTTSMPKGVMVTHGALTAYVMDRTEPADGADHGRMLVAAPFHHIAGVTSMLGALYSGRTVVLQPQFDAGGWLDLVERERVTHAFLVPTMLARLLADPELSKRDLSSLELITYGAAPMPPAIIRRALESFPRDVGFSQAYGQTETTSTVSVLTPEDHRLEGTPEEIELKTRRLSSVGRVVEDVEIRVVAKDGTVLGAGETGEVHLRSVRQMRGYWGDEGDARTAETVDRAGWIHTGDLGFLDEGGYLFLGGRAGDLIIRGGENISPEEVESVIYEHPDVEEVGVVGVPDEDWGEQVLAVVVPRNGSGLTKADLAAFCAEHLAGYKRPAHLKFLDRLPRTSTGKLLRRDLRGLLDG
jgi:acyl-CoA synthetase (AMP-forming)/AMP-acid ligase II